MRKMCPFLKVGFSVECDFKSITMPVFYVQEERFGASPTIPSRKNESLKKVNKRDYNCVFSPGLWKCSGTV